MVKKDLLLLCLQLILVCPCPKYFIRIYINLFLIDLQPRYDTLKDFQPRNATANSTFAIKVFGVSNGGFISLIPTSWIYPNGPLNCSYAFVNRLVISNFEVTVPTNLTGSTFGVCLGFDDVKYDWQFTLQSLGTFTLIGNPSFFIVFITKPYSIFF
jgi:hypothetical protein